MLHNGSGGIDWSGLDVAVELYGVKDVEGLVASLIQAKAYKKPEADAPPAADEDDGE